MPKPLATRCLLDGVEHVVVALPANEDALAKLTAAEREVATRIVIGKSNAEIARERGCSRHTVANQVRSILDKLGAETRSELVVKLYA